MLWSSLSNPAKARPLSPYESQSLSDALSETQKTTDRSPEGKLIDRIHVISLDVVEARDPAPGFLNWFHSTTRPSIIAREVLLRRGDTYSPQLVDESERNLRQLTQLSVVLLVPVNSPRPGHVSLLAITKDVWSLRVNWAPRFAGGTLDQFVFQPTENNLLGSAQAVYTQFHFARHNYAAGVGYRIPRLFGSRIDAEISADAIVNCQSGKTEGSRASFRYGQPLYSTRTRWSWLTSVVWSDSVRRPAGGNQRAFICSGGTTHLALLPNNPQAVDAGTAGSVPLQYRKRSQAGIISVTQSFGRPNKIDVSFGIEARRTAAQYISPEGLNPAALQTLRAYYMPVPDTLITPFVELRAYTTRFLRSTNVNTLGLQEDFRLGHELVARVYPAATALGSTRDVLGVFTGVGHTLAIGSGVLRGYASHRVEASPAKKSDASIELGTAVITPTLGPLRIVWDGRLTDRYLNYLNDTTILGGADRLRGYGGAFYTGKALLVSNLELRTLPLEIMTTQWAMAVFYDVGDAFNGWDELRLKHGAGIGLRFLAPQLDRVVLRTDFVVPLDPQEPGAATEIVVSFRQAFDIASMGRAGLFR